MGCKMNYPARKVRARSASLSPASFGRNWRNAVAFIPVPDVVSVGVVYNLRGEFCQNTAYFSGVSLDTASLSALAASFDSHWNTGVLDLLSEDLSVSEYVVADQSDISGPVFTRVPPTLEVGGVASPALSNNVAFCVSLRTANRGRSFRGRLYLPGISSASMDDPNHLVPAIATNIANAVFTALDQVTVDTGAIPVVVSRFTAGAPRTTGIATPIVTVIAVDNVVDSQRRRLPGRGS